MAPLDIVAQVVVKAEELLVNSFAVVPMYFYTEPLLISPKLKDVYYDALSMHKFTYAYKE